jgi:hypothetical protein
LIIPNGEEIDAARVDVDEEGPASETTMGLAQLALTDPHLKQFVEDVCADTGKALGIVQSGEKFLQFRSAVTGALICGLNLGIRIGEARAIEDVDEDDNGEGT